MERPSLFKEFFKYSKGISFRVALELSLIPRFLYKFFQNTTWEEQARRRFYNSLFKDILAKYDKMVLGENYPQIEKNFKIYIFWYQGWDVAPPIVKLCIDSIERNSNGHEIIYLDKNNIDKYYKFPTFIHTRIDKGQMSLPHFKDLLSCCILNEYGGLWLDACTYVTSPIDVGNSSFFSIRYKNRKGRYCNYKYHIGILGMPRKSFLSSMLMDCLMTYWRNNSTDLHYLFFDDIMKLLYERYEYVRNLLCGNSLYCDCFFEFRYMASERCDDEKEIKDIVEKNNYLSLTYRFPIPLYVDGHPSLLKELLDYCER